MKKILTLASALVLVLMFTATFAFAAPTANDLWAPVGSIFRVAGNEVTITEDLTGYTAPSDLGPYALAWAGNADENYCNTDRSFDFLNWVSVTQWMRIKVENIDRIMLVRKPGTYTLTSKPMTVRLASNGDVLVTFQELYGDGSWNAKWIEFTDKPYPKTANELTDQIPVEKKYSVTTIGDVDAVPPTGFVNIPAGDGVIKFLNSQDLHALDNPINGFDMQFQETIAPCNTTGDYVLQGRIIFQCYNQMWYIVPTTGQIDTTRDTNATPPATYVLNSIHP